MRQRNRNSRTARWMWLMPPGSVPTLAGWALLPLRAFLGVTFCFAGLQKLANPAFFDAANPTSIQAQMAGAVRRSPIHGLISPLAHHAALIGVVIALGEIAVGVGALLGLLTRIAAIGGLLLSLNLFLVVSFHTSPYYTGSDIVFVFAWMPFIIAGGGLLSLDALVANVVAARQSWSGAPIDVDRRRVLGAVTLAAAAVAVLGTGAAAGLGRLFNTASPARSSDELSNGLDSPAVSSPAVRRHHRQAQVAPRRAASPVRSFAELGSADGVSVHDAHREAGDADTRHRHSEAAAAGEQDWPGNRRPGVWCCGISGSRHRRPGDRRPTEGWQLPWF